MIKRWLIYFREMVHPISRLLLSLLLHLAFWAFAHFEFNVQLDGGKLLVGTLTIWMILIYYRVCDEFKDADTDLKYFPDRPVPSGRVKLKDLEILQYVLHISMFAINLFYLESYPFFIAVWLFDFLMGRWFFLPNLISNNRLIAFATHSPIGWFCAWYILGLYVTPSEVLSLQSFLFVTFLNLPAIAWEIGRKMRSPKEEEVGYQTYSSLLGLRGATFLLTVIMLLPLVCLFYIRILNDRNFIIWQVALNFVILTVMLFKISQAHKKSLQLRLTAEIYQGVFLVGLLIQLYFL
jgi:hypothetical protein